MKQGSSAQGDSAITPVSEVPVEHREGDKEVSLVYSEGHPDNTTNNILLDP